MNKIDKPLARLTERKRSAQKLKLRIKEEILQLVPQNTKDHKRILQTIICQQIGQRRRNGYKFLETYTLPRLDNEEKQPEQTNY